jgi:hypothetical protein
VRGKDKEGNSYTIGVGKEIILFSRGSKQKCPESRKALKVENGEKESWRKPRDTEAGRVVFTAKLLKLWTGHINLLTGTARSKSESFGPCGLLGSMPPLVSIT